MGLGSLKLKLAFQYLHISPSINYSFENLQKPCKIDRSEFRVLMFEIKQVAENSFQYFQRHICYLPGGRSVWEKTVPEVLSTARGRRPRAVLKTKGTVFSHTDRPSPVNNIFIFFLLYIGFTEYY